MHVYHVDYDEFFSIKHSLEIRSQWLMNTKLCEEPITQLMDRYGIMSKRVLSIGPSYGHEEYWFYKKGGCSLTFVDIDESHTIENYLKQISLPPESQMGNVLTYGIGDANDLHLETEKKFDVCYFSGFTPNELRNAEVYARIPKSFASRALRRFSSRRYVGWSWPQEVKPLLDLVVDISNVTLAYAGLFIYQSYASGVDVRTQGYLSLMKKQLESIGVTLADAYLFVNYPSLHLIVAYKGSESGMKDYLKAIEKKPELTRIHGRAQVEFKGLAKLYDIRKG